MEAQGWFTHALWWLTSGYPWRPMRRFAPIILVALIAAGVVLLTTTGRQQAAPEAPESAPLFPNLAGDELRAALHDYAAAGHDPLSYRRAREIVYWQLDNDADHVVTRPVVADRVPPGFQDHRRRGPVA